MEFRHGGFTLVGLAVDCVTGANGVVVSCTLVLVLSGRGPFGRFRFLSSPPFALSLFFRRPFPALSFPFVRCFGLLFGPSVFAGSSLTLPSSLSAVGPPTTSRLKLIKISKVTTNFIYLAHVRPMRYIQY